jgi:DNA polymerase-3 subunit alpha
MASFIHLHLHSEYSLIDSTIRIDDLVEAAVEAQMPAVAITDQANLFALVKFYKAAELAGIKPIVGSDVWLTEPEGTPYPVTLLCQNRSGYKNLSILLSQAYRERLEPDRVLLLKDNLSRHSQGLFLLLGPRSNVAHLVEVGHYEQAKLTLKQWQKSFGDRVYLELVRTGRVQDERWDEAAKMLSTDQQCPVIASNDVRFLKREDFEAHEARVCIHAGQILNDPRRVRHYSAEQYLKTPEQMHALFSDIPEALSNTVELAKRCNLELEFGKYHLPAFPVPDPEASESSYLHRKACEGLQVRLDSHGIGDAYAASDYHSRLEFELDVIVKMGFAGYFLIVSDFIGWAKKNGIPVGPGRGSGAGSLVAYSLGITDLDPLRYGLLFERFLNPDRVSMPDFDIDFCMDRRDEVIDYVGKRYGRERVSQIITYGSMAAKAVLRDTGRVLGMSYGHVDRIAKTIPFRPLDISLDDALGVSPKSIKEPERVSADFKKAYETEEDVRQLVDLARSLEDLTRNAGKHAGGVVIAPSDLTDFTPLYSEASGDPTVTQFDKDDIETVGLVKFDFLGLRTLTIIDWTVKAINQRNRSLGQPLLDIHQIPLNDVKAYDLLKACNTTAVFQFESRGMKDMLRKLRPDVFDDIISAGALYRPGPLQSGMVDEFIERKHGHKKVIYPHPLLEPILKPTYGVIVYQEQVMQIAQVLADYTLGGADLLRRAMGKKKPEEMAKERIKFEAGAQARGIDPHLATSIFDLMEKFSEYGFNKSHSAAYAMISYQTAYLKAHFTADFMAAVLSADMQHTDKVVNFLIDTRQQNIQVLPPSINTGSYAFEAIDAKQIRYGLGAIKGVGEGAIDAITAERARNGVYRSLLDLCQRIDSNKLNKRVLEALVLSGSLDEFGLTRASLFAQLPEIMKAASQHQSDKQSGQVSLFDSYSDMPKAQNEPLVLAVPEEWPLMQILNGERDTLGHYLSGHPIDTYKDALNQITTCAIGKLGEVYKPTNYQSGDRRRQEQMVVIAGLVSSLRRRGDQMSFVKLEDASDQIEVSFFREALIEFSPLLTKDNVIVVEGSISLDEFSGNLQIRARQAYSLDEAFSRFCRQLKIKLNSVKNGFANHLAEQLKAYVPGSSVLRIVYQCSDAEAEIELGERWRVRVTPDLLKTLRAMPEVKSLATVFAKSSPTRASGTKQTDKESHS